MKVHISSAVSNMTPSVTLALSAKANEMKAEGVDVCAFTAGEPDFDTPIAIRNAATEAIAKGGKVCKYSPGSGLPELKKAVADKFKKAKGEAFGALSSAKVANEDNYIMQKFTRAVMKTNNIDHCARL